MIEQGQKLFSTSDIKREALVAMAQAFYRRGSFIQYDECSMDRILKLTPRRRKMLPPEAATSQYTLFLDCSSFVSAVYYQTFGYMLPADLTWNMIDYVEPRVYYYELTHKETSVELRKLEVEIRELLKIGDIITFQKNSGGGHTMLYIGNDSYIDCSPNGRPGSYDYINRCDRLYPEGGIWIKNLDILFAQSNEVGSRGVYLFGEDKRRFSISRPLDILSSPKAEALTRLGDAKSLTCGVETSHPNGCHACIGETVEYRVFVKNEDTSPRKAEILFECPEGAAMHSPGAVVLGIEPGELVYASFKIVVEEEHSVFLNEPSVYVNGLHVYAPRILCGEKLNVSEAKEIVERIIHSIHGGVPVFEAASKVYADYNIQMDASEKKCIYSHFSFHNSTKGEVLSRRVQNPRDDYTVYAMYGGTGVITPIIASVPNDFRTTTIYRRDLQVGDIVLCSDDPFGNVTYSSIYTGVNLLGSFEKDGITHIISDIELDQFLESLQGRFCWLLLRPCLSKKEI